LDDCGIVLEAEGPPEELVKFALKSKVPLSLAQIQKIQQAISARVPKGMKQHKATRLQAIIEKLMPELSPQDSSETLPWEH
jgi:hypothetical protein